MLKASRLRQLAAGLLPRSALWGRWPRRSLEDERDIQLLHDGHTRAGNPDLSRIHIANVPAVSSPKENRALRYRVPR